MLTNEKIQEIIKNILEINSLTKISISDILELVNIDNSKYIKDSDELLIKIIKNISDEENRYIRDLLNLIKFIIEKKYTIEDIQEMVKKALNIEKILRTDYYNN